ncbi:MAG: 30S ribosomal protein S15 [Candidatus Levybacteria bacterium GW2011_GWA1_37_16]|nr:MAG: 30S ribosomal protein S15 [Candidatus Levybacteria bacterium GW2011_GWA1_37_16]KKQ41496.1 MAG: 30S ribosomal protein S15 [Candidatus Levybacteria bacterium GW2011_GWB1_37_8]
MPLSTTLKKKVIKEFQTVAGDTGSPEVQIALLTTRIDRLTEHLKMHIHDTHSRRGLLSMIAKRRRLINFLTKVDKKRSTEIEKKIGFDKKPLEKTEKVEKVAKAEKAAKAKKTTKTK